MTWRQDARAAGWRPPKSRPTERRQVETPEYVAMVTRILRALGARCGDDPTNLRALGDLQSAVNDALTLAVAAARQAHPPYSWTEIGRELGITRQAAQQRFGS